MHLDDRATFLLSQLGYHVADRFAEQLAPLGLQPAQFGVLAHLARVDGRSQQELADLLGIHRNVMVGIVDALEAQDLVRRERHPLDRRAHAVHLTDGARAVLAAAVGVVDELEADVMAPLDAAELETLIAMLRRLAAHTQLPAGVHPQLHRRAPRR
ncbi:MarR family winged helix-turn-helix transcriptional regulator [Pseudonocardia sp. TRM90224]|uniref:MarR family winged helix-turn-helix transcriptional regulator n=1 Tax=Pseudonocardia sp. TRM90224 TaxID=2812678 RepID=UPI001E32108B|nr:MarR family transcriptional regulator [Pseudonocardia sp. TRM90224]